MSLFVDIFWSLVGPWMYLWAVLKFLPGAVRNIYENQGVDALSIPRIKRAWFSAFWTVAGANIRKRNGPMITALYEGRVTNGRVVDTPVMPPLGGVVLEIGPGNGNWVDLLAEFKHDNGGVKTRSQGSLATKLQVYGVEPSTDTHASLRKHIVAAEMEDSYEIVPVGIEALGDHGIEPESVDCIVSLLCLCGIPEPEKNIAELYKYLKKGGRWYLYEHVQVKRSVMIRAYQAFVNLFWPHMVGGCELCRDTETTLRNAGVWAKVDIAQPPDENWHQVIQHIFGTLTK